MATVAELGSTQAGNLGDSYRAGEFRPAFGWTEFLRSTAASRVVVLDPACGTGAYLLEALRYTAEQLDKDGAGATLPARLLDAACRRFIGFEILTAPFVVAQLQLYLMLARLGATPDEKHRPAVFLTNALTGWHGPDQLKLNFPELQDEHDAARCVKRDAKIIVVLWQSPV